MLIFILKFLKISRTKIKCFTCSSGVLEKINISSIKIYTQTPIKSNKILFISLWNVAGALHRPNGITLNTKLPYLVVNRFYPHCHHPIKFDDTQKINPKKKKFPLLRGYQIFRQYKAGNKNPEL